MNLNPNQSKAVKHTEGALLIIAGAGSGKTRVITTRIAHLIKDKLVNPSSIIALTFTNKAAKEMKERIASLTSGEHGLPFIGTFHSYCLRLLKTHGYHINLENFTIFDSSDQEKLLHDIIKRFALDKKTSARQLTYHISNAKNCAALGETYPLFEYDKTLQEIFLTYEEEKSRSKCLDFDDLIIKGVELFENDAFKKQHHTNVRHVLVDEYQDTSVIQHSLLKHMSLSKDKTLTTDSVCVVGDEDQSIYSWRGATVDNILQFPNEFPKVKVVKIEQNYRSADSILETANHLIKNNENRTAKKLWSDKKAKDRVLVLNAVSGYQEADLAAKIVGQQNLNNNNSIAILYRTHFQSRTVEESLLKQSIPYKIVGGIQFYERKEIKDLLAHLKVIINPFDKISFSRIYNCPPRKLGAQFAEQFFGLWQSEAFWDYKEVAKSLINQGGLTRGKEESLEFLVKILTNIDVKDSPSQTLASIVEQIKYSDYLKDAYSVEDAQSRIDNIRELIRAAKHFEDNGTTTISAFIDEISLMQDKIAEQSEEQTQVQLMTLHAAKGLEFDTVIITGVEEGLLPSNRSLNSSEEIEEERRLLYVGITRAREHLVLMHAKTRNTYGQVSDQSPSRFIGEVSKMVPQQIDCSYLDAMQTKQIISYFLTNKKISISASPAPARSSSAFRLQSYSTPTKSFGSKWRINQPVKHKVFGIGLVKKIDQREDSSILTIKFKIGFKKISDRFIERS